MVSTEITGWSLVWAAITPRVDALELRVAVGMVRAVVRFAVALTGKTSFTNSLATESAPAS
ncbi:hypothetical protein CO676_33880 [Sinorhizobium sp. BJ1]|nr:hypothetical protein CO676_33880 [Sinorhizobium sp. BJ1]